MAVGAAGGEDRARRAFVRAVARERDAIELHDRAADLHEALAARLEEAAGAESDPPGVGLRQRAAVERALAADARRRAAGVRHRLRAEGVDLDADVEHTGAATTSGDSSARPSGA